MDDQRIAQFELIERIGEGGMGVVWKARDMRLNRIVALKLLPREKTGDAMRRLRFTQEAQTASALNHPNIVTIYDINEDAGRVFIAMEYIEGKTLEDTKLWQSELDGSGGRVVVDAIASRGFSVAAGRIFFLHPESGGRTTIRYLQLSSGAVTTVATLTKPLYVGLSASPDGQFVIYS